MNPLGVKTKVVTLPNNDVLMEVQVMNSATCPLALDRVKFEVSELFIHTDLNTDVFGPLLNIGDTRQYLYLLQPSIPGDPIALSTSALGKLDIRWKTNMGQSGRLQTATLSRKVTQLPQFELRAINLPTRMTVEVPFEVECLVTNNGDTARITVSGVKSRMGSVLLSGTGDKHLGNVVTCTNVVLSFFPLYSGLHRISGLRISDAISGNSLDVDHLADVFINDI